MDRLAVILVLVGVGVVLRRTAVFPDETPRVLNLFVIYVTVPALILLRVPSLSVSSDLLVPALLPWVLLAVSAAAVLGFARLRRLDRSTTGALLIVVPLGNTSFLGFPMIATFLGESALSYAVLYDQVGTFLALVTYGSFVLASYGDAGSPTPRSVLKRVVAFPPFVALLLALAMRGVAYPHLVRALLDAVAATLVPVVMVAVGMQLDLRLEKGSRGPLAFGLAVKMGLAPLLALGLCHAFGIRTEAAHVAVLEAGMPPIVTGGALASAAGLAPKLAAALVGLGLLLSFLTIPILVRLL